LKSSAPYICDQLYQKNLCSVNLSEIISILHLPLSFLICAICAQLTLINYKTPPSLSFIPEEKEKTKMIELHLTYFIIPTGTFFGYQINIPHVILISTNESVSTLCTKIRDTLLYKYRNASFNLRAVDVERREYVYMEPEKKVSNYFNSRPPAEITIHILIEEA
ncbi:11940_t:CDS:2, partial [Diversispora eburnea]